MTKIIKNIVTLFIIGAACYFGFFEVKEYLTNRTVFHYGDKVMVVADSTVGTVSQGNELNTGVKVRYKDHHNEYHEIFLQPEELQLVK